MMIKDLPNKLKSMRQKYGYSQRQIGEKLGISPSIVSAYETGERTPSTEVLLALSYLFNCSTDYLLGRKNDDTTISVNADGLTPAQLHAIIALIDSIREK